MHWSRSNFAAHVLEQFAALECDVVTKLAMTYFAAARPVKTIASVMGSPSASVRNSAARLAVRRGRREPADSLYLMQTRCI
jgi:hypothetical protein